MNRVWMITCAGRGLGYVLVGRSGEKTVKRLSRWFAKSMIRIQLMKNENVSFRSHMDVTEKKRRASRRGRCSVNQEIWGGGGRGEGGSTC